MERREVPKPTAKHAPATEPDTVVPFSALAESDLVIDATYKGGRSGNSGDDPLNALMKVSLMGGFRYRGSLDALEVVVLTTTLNDPEWPDAIDRDTGVFTYYGDNKKPGRALHETPRHGNEILRQLFDMAHGGPDRRVKLPPIFVFASAGTWRDVIFIGLVVPGTADLRASEDLVAIWKTAGGRRFQNYRARFTILDIPAISREWINDIIARNAHSPNAPSPWKAWIDHGEQKPLLATRSIEHRRKHEQVPSDDDGRAIIKIIHDWFSGRPHDFEKCAAVIAKLMLPDVASLDLTRPSRDGGRDATGQLRIGIGQASILVDFAIEAKCYAPGSSVGVREISRLISRLRHRQFGILVTTSYLDSQAYQEIKEDQHPIIVIAAIDILGLLRANGRADVHSVREWLVQDFSPGTQSRRAVSG